MVNRRNRAQTARFHFQSEAPGIGRSGEVVWQVEHSLIPASLMVVIDPQMSATAQYADYVIGPQFGFELPAISFASLAACGT